MPLTDFGKVVQKLRIEYEKSQKEMTAAMKMGALTGRSTTIHSSAVIPVAAATRTNANGYAAHGR